MKTVSKAKVQKAKVIYIIEDNHGYCSAENGLEDALDYMSVDDKLYKVTLGKPQKIKKVLVDA